MSASKVETPSKVGRREVSVPWLACVEDVSLIGREVVLRLRRDFPFALEEYTFGSGSDIVYMAKKGLQVDCRGSFERHTLHEIGGIHRNWRIECDESQGELA
ncbi:hypothetical protein ACHAPO_004488 [Fusarium lateritium]